MLLRAQSKRESVARERIAALWAAASDKLNCKRLAYLAVRVKNDVFAKVTESIDGMVVQLDTELHNEAHKQDGCTKEVDTNEKQTVEQIGHKKDAETITASTPRSSSRTRSWPGSRQRSPR